MPVAPTPPDHCHVCATPLRERAAFCDRCGTPQVQVGRTGPSWPLVVVLVFVVGLLLGALTAATLGWRFGGAVPVRRADVGQDATPAPAAELREAPPPGPLPPVTRVDAGLRPGAPPEETTAERATDAVPVAPPDLRATFGSAVIELLPRDPEGDPRPAVPCVALAAERVLAPYSAIEGAASATVRGPDRRALTVTGVLRFDAAYDLALLAVDGALPAPWPEPRAAPVATSLEATLLGPDGDDAWSPALLVLEPGGTDRWSGGPRLTLPLPASFPGVAFDADHALVALVPDPAAPARAVHPAAGWGESDAAPIPLDVFRLSIGHGSPASRLADARKLLQQRRHDEAARLLLQITAEDPGLLQDVREDLLLAVTEAARRALGAGNGHAAVLLATETLARLPDAGALWALRARGEALTGQVTASIRSFLAAGEVEPAGADGWRAEARGILQDEVNRLHAAGRTVAALALLLEQRDAFPTDGRLRMTAGQLLLESRRFAEAARLYDEAAVLDATVAAEARRAAERARDLAGGPGAIAIDYPPGSRRVVVPARIDGAGPFQMEIDPARDTVIVPVAAADAAGYALAGAPRVRFHADPRAEEVPSIRLRTVTVNGVAVDRLPALVVDGQAPPDADGVLGAPFVARFRLVDDRGLGRMVLHPR